MATCLYLHIPIFVTLFFFFLTLHHKIVFYPPLLFAVSGSPSPMFRTGQQKNRVCSSDVTNKASYEFRTGYWLEGSCLESNYIKGCSGNICHTKIAADDKRGPTRL